MRTALAILGAVVLVPLALGFVGGFALACCMPWLSRWLKRRAAKAEAIRRGDWPPIPAGTRFPPPPPAPPRPH